MRLPRPRFTVGRLMILVAVAGVLTWLVSVLIRRDDYRRRADQHEQTAATLAAEIAIFRSRGGAADEIGMREKAMADEERDARRYRRAQARPWMPLGPEDRPGATP